MTTITLAGQSIEIGGAGDLARRWGVTTQRVRQLTQVEGFPPMLGEVNGQPVYDVEECDAWREATRRRPGRPARFEGEGLRAVAKSVAKGATLHQLPEKP